MLTGPETRSVPLFTRLISPKICSQIDAITADVEDFDDAFLEEKAKDILEDIDCRAPNSLGSALHDAFGGFLEEEVHLK